MKADNGRLSFSPSDLTAYVECEHLTRLELAVARGGRPRPGRDDPQADLIRRKGSEHEDAYLARLRAAGLDIADIDIDRDGDGDWDWPRAARETEQALRDGRDVIYQAALVDGDWRGLADFVERGADGSYEVVDTKLARHAKPSHIFQLCFYSSVVERLQGSAPEWMHIELGSGERESFRVADFDAYYRRIRDRFLRAAASPAETYPWPVGHCAVCSFIEACEARWKADDALVQVANISRKQIDRLTAAGIATLEQLGKAPAGLVVPRISDSTLATLRQQASLQLHRRTTGEHRVERIATAEGRGFALLPEPDPADAYFDIEGDPFYSPRGSLEYLFGVAWAAAGEARFLAFWARDEDEERVAFERLVDWIVERRQAAPGMHVYHYANYEQAALQRLMQKHGTREDEVDDLLRGGVLVDLFQVVRQALRLSLPSYSLKEVEKLYFPERETEVVGGAQSTVVFEQWIETGDDALLRSIEDYNRDDCVSTLELHRWLLVQRPEIPWAEPPEPYVETDEGERRRTEREELQARLLEGATDGDSRWLAAHLLDYHRRDAKPAWWDYFRRLKLDERELVEDSAAIGAIELDASVEPYPEKNSLVWELTFPPQELKVGADGRDPATGAPAGEILEIDEILGRIKLKRGRSKWDDPLPRALVPGPPLKTWTQQDAVLRVVRGLVDGTDQHRAARDVLTRSAPRAALHGSLVDAALSLDRSYLFVQGPPGSGKTYLGAEAAVELMRQGRRVGVASLSHKAIHNFLDDVERWADEKGVDFQGLKKCSDRKSTRFEGSTRIENSGKPADFEGSDHNLIAGTSWLFAREKVHVDCLFVDEAGQVALADALAMASSADNLVLLGDPNQLPQVSQGAQPEAVRASVLEHLLGNAETVPAGRGLFLPHTFRLRPEICRFVSDAFYEGRLEPDDVCLRRSLEGGVGLRFVPVEHDGNRQSSAEEADAVRELIEGLLGTRFTDADGSQRPLTGDDVLVVAAYNAQVRCLRAHVPDGVRVGTVDRFQGQQAPVVLFSTATSTAEDLPRGLEFLFSPNRFNVAISRAQCLAVVVASPRLLEARCRTPEQMRLVNLVCRFAEAAG